MCWFKRITVCILLNLSSQGLWASIPKLPLPDNAKFVGSGVYQDLKDNRWIKSENNSSQLSVERDGEGIYQTQITFLALNQSTGHFVTTLEIELKPKPNSHFDVYVLKSQMIDLIEKMERSSAEISAVKAALKVLAMKNGSFWGDYSFQIGTGACPVNQCEILIDFVDLGVLGSFLPEITISINMLEGFKHATIELSKVENDVEVGNANLVVDQVL